MAQDQQSRPVPPVVTPQQFVPPSMRELRSQAVHRLQVGLFGLAAMLLLVGLANIIMDRARLTDETEAQSAQVSGEVEEKAASDPLADIGVVPAADPSASADQTAP
jgi:hypothetical protein